MKTITLLKSNRLNAVLKLVFVASILLCLPLFSYAAVPADSEELSIDDITYTLDGASLTITGYTGAGQTETYLYIPETYTIDEVTYTVTELGTNAFMNAEDNITNVILPSTLVSLGLRSFQNCSLDSITIPANVTTISKWTFRICKSLTKVIFEEGSQLNEIGVEAFKNCVALSSFILPSERPGLTATWSQDGAIISDYEVLSASYGSAFSAVWLDASAIVGELILNANSGVAALDTISTILDVTITLPTNLFAKEGAYLVGWSTTADGDIFCSDGAPYTPLTVSDSLFAIWAPITADFEHSEMLKLSDVTYTIDDTTISIAAYNRGDQDSTFLHIPSTYAIDGVSYTLTALGGDLFRNKTGVTNVILPSTLLTIGNTAFFNTGLDSITIPASVTAIASRAFKSTTTISKVVFEEESHLSYVGLEVFYECDNLASFTLPSHREGYVVEWTKVSDPEVVLQELVVPSTDFEYVYTAVWTESIVTSIDDNTSVNGKLVIAPNPANDNFTINVAVNSTQIYSVSGKCVKQFPMGVSSFDISSLERGIYFVKVEQANGDVYVSQLVKQ